MKATVCALACAILAVAGACGSTDSSGAGDSADVASDAADIEQIDVSDGTSDTAAFCDGGTICDGRCVETDTDSTHCGECGRVCAPGGEHALVACEAAECVSRCEDRWFDFDEDGSCESFCVQTNQGVEACDGVDNDCDGLVDTADDSFATLVCAEQLGVCEGATATCTDGTAVCDYRAHAATRRFQPVETLCDRRDNDCDGASDETCCSPATTPQIDDLSDPLDIDGLEVHVAAIAHGDAVAHVLLRATHLDVEADLHVAWRAESSAVQLSYHPASVDSHLVASPVLADGVFRDNGWDVWFVENDMVQFARIEPDALAPVEGVAVDLEALPASAFTLSAFAIDADRTALYVANNDDATVYVLDRDSQPYIAYSLGEPSGPLLGVWSDGGALYALKVVNSGDVTTLEVFDLDNLDATALASFAGIPLMVPFVESPAGGLVGAVFADGVSRVLSVRGRGDFAQGDPLAESPWQCVAAWSDAAGATGTARYVESDGSGALELLGAEGPLEASWVGELLCPLVARAGDDLITVAVGLIGDRLSRRVALVSTAPDGEYYCAEAD